MPSTLTTTLLLQLTYNPASVKTVPVSTVCQMIELHVSLASPRATGGASGAGGGEEQAAALTAALLRLLDQALGANSVDTWELLDAALVCKAASCVGREEHRVKFGEAAATYNERFIQGATADTVAQRPERFAQAMTYPELLLIAVKARGASVFTRK